MIQIRLTEENMLHFLGDQGLRLGPTELKVLSNASGILSRQSSDRLIEARWGTRCQIYVFECKARDTPKVIETAMAMALQASNRTGYPPLIIVPFLSEERIQALEAAGVSGVDLGGNGVLFADDFSIWRSGNPNRFPDDQPIRNIYRGTSSIVARCFLLRPEFGSLKELREFALARMPLSNRSDLVHNILTKGTISKVVGILEEELIVQRERGVVRVNDARQLMVNFRENYRSSMGSTVEGQTRLSPSEAWQLLEGQIQDNPENDSSQPQRYVATGTGSASSYNLLSSGQKLTLYVSDLKAASTLLDIQPTRVFPNIELIEEKSESVYFDSRRKNGLRWSSPVQVWLELARGGPREREASEILEAVLVQSRGEEIP